MAGLGRTAPNDNDWGRAVVRCAWRQRQKRGLLRHPINSVSRRYRKDRPIAAATKKGTDFQQSGHPISLNERRIKAVFDLAVALNDFAGHTRHRTQQMKSDGHFAHPKVRAERSAGFREGSIFPSVSGRDLPQWPQAVCRMEFLRTGDEYGAFRCWP